MMSKPDCLSREQLAAYCLGDLEIQSLETIDDHVEICQDCQATIVDLGDLTDSLISQMRQPVAAVKDDPELQRLLDQVQNIPLGTVSSQEEKTIDEQGESGLGLIGQYQLLEKLGEGGMGTVYRARHPKLKRNVALKVLSKERIKDTIAVARFEREMEAVGALDHPNIVRAHDAGEHEGTHFLVMEHVQGIDLSQLAERCGPLPIAEACELIRQAAIGLEHARENGLVHRDIKPSNLMLNNKGVVKILDLGLALLQGRNAPDHRGITTTGHVMGTLDYMAPEQGDDSHEVDIRADIYSLGGTLYKLICGEAPFGAYESPIKKMMALATEPIQPITERRPEVSAELESLISRMLAHEVDDRFATPAEVAMALEPFAAPCDLAELVSKATGSPRSKIKLDPSSKGSSVRLSLPTEDTRPEVATAPKTAPAGRQFRKMVATIAVALGGIVLLGVLLTIRTPQGTLTIEIAEPYRDDVELIVKGGGKEVTISDKSGWEISLKDGTYQLEVHGSNDRFQLSRDTVTVKRGKEELVKVTLKPLSAKLQLNQQISTDARSGIYLDDVKESDFSVGWGTMGKHGAAGYRNKMCRLWGEIPPHAISIHPPAESSSYVTYDLDGSFKKFQAMAVVWEGGGGPTESPITFEVFGDGKLLWQSRQMQRQGDGQNCSIDIQGVRELKLQANCHGGSARSYAAWLYPQVFGQKTSEGVTKSDQPEENEEQRAEELSQYLTGAKWSWGNTDGIGWIMFHPENQMTTKWGVGTWKVIEESKVVVEFPLPSRYKNTLTFSKNLRSFQALRSDGQESDGILLFNE